MAWKRVIKNSDLEKCLNIIISSAEHYSELTLEDINRNIDRKRGEMFYYNSEETKIAVMFQWNYTKKMWRLKHAAYQGGDPIDAMIITWDKIKDFLVEHKEDKGYIIVAPIKDYNESQQPYLTYLKQLEEITMIENQGISKWNINL